MSLKMPAISNHAHQPQVSSTIPPTSSLNWPWALCLLLSKPLVLICLFFFGVPLTLYVLRRLVKLTSNQPPSSPATDEEIKVLRNNEILESTWPPSSLVTLAPESRNLPSPTIRRNSPSAFIPAPTPRTSKSRTKTWPATGGLLRRETMEEVNGCRRHVMVFGRQS